MSRSDRSSVAIVGGWSDTIEQATRSLPEDPACDHDFYLALLSVNAAVGGRTAVIERGGEPIAVIGLQPDGTARWRNALNWRVPGFVAASSIDVIDAVSAIRAEIYLAWWRMPAPPTHPAIRSTVETPVHVLDVAHRHEYWRSNRTWSSIRRAREKCMQFRIEVDEPGAAEWVIRSAAEKWDGPSGRTSAATEVALETARQLRDRGRLVTLAMYDGDRPLAGTTNIVDGATLIGGGLFRDDSVGSLPTGVRIIDEAFEYAEREGLETVDMGGGYAYKSRWAPADGVRYDLIVSPALLFRARRVATRARELTRFHGKDDVHEGQG